MISFFSHLITRRAHYAQNKSFPFCSFGPLFIPVECVEYIYCAQKMANTIIYDFVATLPLSLSLFHFAMNEWQRMHGQVAK